MTQQSASSHRRIPLVDPEMWVFYASPNTAKRLVVFVHGFGGDALRTWNEFQSSGSHRGEWWDDADMLFVGYHSMKEDIGGVSRRLRGRLPEFYPTPNRDVLWAFDSPAREDIETPYDELVVIGHSLGGLIARRALVDCADRWCKEGADPETRPALLDSKLRLFSPASAGVRLSGWKALAASAFWPVTDAFLRRSPAYTDLQQGSETLTSTRRRTEALVHERNIVALQASILWANPDTVVLSERYDTDLPEDWVDGPGHISVCKPHSRYDAPWTFAETGRY